MDAMQFHLKWKAFILASEVPFKNSESLWSIQTGKTISIMLWIQAKPEKEDWLDLLTAGQPVVFKGIQAETKDKITTRTVRAQWKTSFRHGMIWEVSFSP